MRVGLETDGHGSDPVGIEVRWHALWTKRNTQQVQDDLRRPFDGLVRGLYNSRQRHKHRNLVSPVDCLAGHAA